MSENVCCSDKPPVVSEDYKPKGIYSTVGKTKVYVTGPEKAPRGLLSVYDIFGYFPPTIQGADAIAGALGIKVVMPDFFEGEPMDTKNYPPDTEEKKQKLQAFFESGKGKLQPAVEKVKSLVPEFEAEYKIEKWAIMGYCWGGKITTLCSQEGTPFTASIQIHPAMLDPNDADKIAIPHMCLASRDENKGHVAESKRRIENHPIPKVRERSVVKAYEDMFHGWMAARVDLKDEKYREGYRKGYADVISFLRKNLLE